MTDTILCIDIGTSSLKAALLPDNFKNQEIFVSRKEFPKSAFEEQNSAEFYLPALKEALLELHDKNPDYGIEAVCISGNGPTVISESGKTLLYSDEIPNSALRRTKSLFIPRLIGFKEKFPDDWRDTAHVFGSNEFMIHELTGQAVSVLPADGFLQAYWTSDELRDCGFSDSDIKKIPPLKKMGTLAGKVSGRAALATGLLEGTLVFAGAPDFVVALIGTGTIFPGRLCYRAGTSEGLNLCTSKPVFMDGLRTLPGVLPGLWNLSYLVDSARPGDEEFCRGINLLRHAANLSGERFPDFMTITGGQALSGEVVLKKERLSGLKIRKLPCAGACELLGDLILARVALGDFDDIEEAVFALIGG